jgi:hypothetical protein
MNNIIPQNNSSDLKLSIFRKIDQLPEQSLTEINELLNTYITTSIKSKKQKRGFVGSIPNLVVYMAEDFDAPLEDFKEYM